MGNQAKTHPLKWSSLLEDVQRSGMEDPDIWIEDLRRYGPIKGVERTVVDMGEDTDGVEASFSVIVDAANNRIVIRHHY